MDMGSMTMPSDPSSTMSGMDMSSPTGMSSSDHGHSSMMGMDMMSMTFFIGQTTPLFTTSWTPNTTGQYAGTCIFLITFAAIFRALLAVRVNFYQVLAVLKHRRGEDMRYMSLSDEKVTTQPWRVNEAVYLSFVDVILAGIGYLLMIAVMTMNVGYFLSVLAGVFVGSMVFGHFMAHSASH